MMYKRTLTTLTVLALFLASTMLICFGIGIYIDHNVPRNLRCSVSGQIPRTFSVLIVSHRGTQYQIRSVPYRSLQVYTRPMKQWSFLIPVADEKRLSACLARSTEDGHIRSAYLHSDIVAFRVTRLERDKQRVSLISRDQIVRYCYVASMHTVKPVYFSVYVGQQNGYYVLGGLLGVLTNCIVWLLVWVCIRIVRKRGVQRDAVHH